MHTVLTIIQQFAAVTLPAFRNLAILALVFTLFHRLFRSCNPGAPWWRKRDLVTDLCYALVPRLFNLYAQLALLVIGIALLYGIDQAGDIASFMKSGIGPLAGLPFWQQVIIYLLGNDLMMYLTHRAFHSARLWRFHAVHHSTEELEWTSATRFHPVDQAFHGGLADVAMLLLGISPDVLIWLAPWTVGSSALVHANLDWTFGPLRYVLASPVYHRWHHTSAERGGSSNFAGTFPFYDVMFGTFYMPQGERPDAYGQDDPKLPRDFIGQLIYPFLPRRRPESAEIAGPATLPLPQADGN